MNIEHTIRNRRSIGLVKSDPLEKLLIEKLLDAAVHAPNHHCTEPWRFFVMTGSGRDVLGRAYALIASESMQDPTTEENQMILKKQHGKAFRAPVVITVAAVPLDSPKVEKKEELAAVHAAVQNILLQAHALGLGAIWRTGEPAYHREMKKAFGLTDEAEVVGFIYVGYPLNQPASRVSPSYAEKTIWLDGSK
ncbi:MAG: yfhC 1 [Bacilli bacterium]|nr:yfhC 1 [Bacilli bacterium]